MNEGINVEEIATRSISVKTTTGIIRSPQNNDTGIIPNLKCWSCSSNVPASNCINTLVNSSSCESPVGMCYTFVEDNTVIRGCVGDKVIPDTARCDDPTSCSICSNRYDRSDMTFENSSKHFRTNKFFLGISKRSGCNNDPIVTSEACLSYELDTNFTESNNCPTALKASGCFHMEIDGKLYRKGFKNFSRNLNWRIFFTLFSPNRLR